MEKLSKKCLWCNKEFFKKPTHSIKIWNTVVKFCSISCKAYWLHKNKLCGRYGQNIRITTICPVCKTSFLDYPSSKRKFCSPECSHKGQLIWNKGLKGFRSGDKNNNWKGGISKNGKYLMILMPEHPFSNKSGHIFLHRYSVECILGRFLDPKEAIHHIDEDKTNNLPENLYLFKNNGLHTSYHFNIKSGKTLPITQSNLKINNFS